ncbi:MMPL family transporter [Pelobacter propionicus]|uniref:Putative rRNA methylase n=1 Tax=Pelobacter propionicus (strain DSM 2379 / NBRC 103807 / OttBd1) TaxID=338966 RepID=A1API7_PELPD|nr:MMPL family transporter [Pelobacter propionicus]ABK99257.1 putative rRNA methylase [Pelobacter propionicus DSM 2379]
MPHRSFHSRLFAFIARHPRLILGVALLLSVISVIYTKQNMEFLTGRDDLMPRNAAFQVDYRAYRQEFGDQEEVVIVVESDDAELSTRCADAIYQRLSREKGVYRELFYPGGLPYFRKNGLLFMPLEEIRNLRSTLTMAAPVLKDLAASPTVQTLFTSLTSQIDVYLATGDQDSLKSLTFMLTTLDKGFKAFDGKSSGLSMDSFLKGSTDGKGSLLESAGKQQVITILPVKEQGSFVPAEKAITTTRAILRQVMARPDFKGINAGLTGVPVLEYEEMATSQHDIAIATVLSLSLTVVLLLFAFRGLLNVISAMVSLIVGICLSFGFATAVIGHLNILSMVFAIMLIGLGIEYGIQVVLRYQEELRGGADGMQAIETGLGANMRSIVMAAATVALAFATFAFTDFKGIAELGIIAAGGVVICVLATFSVLPAMLILLERFRKPAKPYLAVPDGDREVQVAGRPLFRALLDRPRMVAGMTLLLSLICVYPAIDTRFDYNLMNLQAKGLQSVEYAYKLMRSKENSGYFAVVMAKDRQEAQQLTRRLEQLPSVDHVVSLDALVPDQQEAKLAELAELKRVMDQVRPVPYEENLALMELPMVFENFHDRVAKLKQALEKAGAAEARPVAAFLTTLDGFFASLEKEKDRNAVSMLRDFQGGMFAQLPDKLAMMKESLEAAPVGEADVPAQLKQRFVGTSGKLLLQVAPRKEIFEHKPLSEFVSQVKSVVPNATGEPVMVYESLTVLRDSYLRAFAYAFIGIAVILLINFKSIRFALLGTLPLVAGLLLMVGGMWLAGVSFNSANIIVLPLILGVGIDSAIYIINRYRQGNESPAQVALSSAGIGVFLNALTILFSFGALMVAHHQGVFSIGAVMSLGMVASVAVFLVFLPALLCLWGKR